MYEFEKEIAERHSVRSYLKKPVEPRTAETLRAYIEAVNAESGLNIQLIENDPETFTKNLLHYGWLKNAENYFALIGKSAPDLEEKAGYFGEKCVLKAQALGLNTCWIAGTYSKKHVKAEIKDGEELVCVISVGYGENAGKERKSKEFKDVTENAGDAPEWFARGVNAALLAPTAINQQKFTFSYTAPDKVKLTAQKGPFSLIDKGIVKLHFELAAGKESFKWE